MKTSSSIERNQPRVSGIERGCSPRVFGCDQSSLTSAPAILRRGEQGSVLLITMFVAVMFGLLLLYCYLPLVNNQRVSVSRSQAWNGALTMAEAGVEEALAQLNPGAAYTGVDRTANGWGSPVGTIYGPKSRTLADGTYDVSYTTDVQPIIYSTGHVAVPLVSATLTRVLRVATTNVPLYNDALVAIHGITMNGSGISADSFNSANTNLSTNGQYDPLKAGTNGNIASVYGPIDLGNHTINGDVAVGPGVTPPSGGVTGAISTNFNPTLPDVVYPANAVFLPAGLPNVLLNFLTGGTLYNYAFVTSGDFLVSSLSGNIYVGPNAVVRLKVTASSSPSGILVDGTGPTAGHLTIYMAGPSFSLSGGAFANGGNATNLTYLGMPSNTSISMSGNAQFIGTIYAPEASVTLGGGGSNPYDFMGSCIANSVTMNGHFRFHFDENLINGASRGYVAVSWREL
ncbi:MAG TPA: hypothetical protein VN578_08015 [Candidatus Binatia bacterium]|jgi:hypothetical protein|nr:hypothetical protein [Candidatus Binatia bacterium]